MTTVKTKTQMERIIEEQEDKIPVFEVGDMVEGEVVGRTGRKLWIDIQGKALGIVPATEVSGHKEDLKEGKKVLSSVVEPEDENGNIILSLRRADKKKAFWDLEKKHQEEEALTVKVFDANRGGLIVGDENFQGFLPVSELSREHYPRVEGGDKEKILVKLKEFINQELSVKVMTFDRNEEKLIFSEKQAVGALDQKSLDQIKVNQTIDCQVSGVADFGLFVQFEDLEGLIHISEISWQRVFNIHKQFKVGDRLKAKIIEIDPERQRISLSIKRLSDDPWKKKIKKFKVGQVIEGQVSRLTPFGAFVTFGQDIEGLIHISEISFQRISDPSEKLNLGDKIKAKIISIELEEHKIGLSLKELESPKPKKPRVKKESLKELISPGEYDKLSKAGIKSLAQLKKKRLEELIDIKGIGEKTAQKLKGL